MLATIFKLTWMTLLGALFLDFAIRVIFWVWVTVLGTILGNIEDYFDT